MSNASNMNSENTITSEPSVVLPSKWDEGDDGWHEVYNSTDKRQGEFREYSKQPGTFYQTYGNGGGEGGWGGYWVRQGGLAVWAVAGDVFTYLDNHVLEYRPQDSMAGEPAMCRVFIPDADEKAIELLISKGMLKKNEKGEYEFVTVKYVPRIGVIGATESD